MAMIEVDEKALLEMIEKSGNWDKLGAEISKCYLTKEGEYIEGEEEIQGADLGTIGEMAASAFGWL